MRQSQPLKDRQAGRGQGLWEEIRHRPERGDKNEWE